jgi:hypothetical protein
MGRTDNAKRNLIWGFIQKIVSVLIRFKNDYDICSWNGIYRIE